MNARGSMYTHFDNYLIYLKVEKNASPKTIASYQKDFFRGLDFFADLLKKRTMPFFQLILITGPFVITWPF